MPNKSALLIFLTVIAVAATVSAAPAVRFTLDVCQMDPTTKSYVLLRSDTVDVVVGTEISGYVHALSLDLKVSSASSDAVNFDVHVNTVAVQTNNYAQRYQVEFGLPAWLTGIVGKHGVEYRLTVTPLEMVDVDTELCEYSHRAAGDFSFDPSAHFDLYYVDRSLADLYWSGLKSLLDTEYRKYIQLGGFTLTGKYSVYACPCEIHSVIWDDRFAMMADPTRLSAFGVYSKGFNTLDPFLLAHLAVQRQRGFSHPLLSEGFAGYYSLPTFDVRRFKSEGDLLKLTSLFETHEYLTSDAFKADREAASFVRYLIDQYSIDEFWKLYDQAHDLNLAEALETVYGTPPAKLESDWQTYVDTLTWSIPQVRDMYHLSRAMFDSQRALEFSKEMLRISTTPKDSLEAWRVLGRAAFESGDYLYAAETLDSVTAREPNSADDLFTLANDRLMNGDYDLAFQALDKAQALDTTNQLLDFCRALGELNRGNIEAAREVFTSIVNKPKGGAGLVESHILLGHLQLQSGDSVLQAEAMNNFSQAIEALGGDLSRRETSSYRAMWLGIAYLGKGDTGAAWDLLQAALFLEQRPFYSGMINLWLGKIADVRGEHDVAREYYGQVITGQSAHFHRTEAQQLIESPYSQ